MKIGIDSRSIFTTERTGIANNAFHLIEGLLKAGVKLTLFTNSKENNPFNFETPNMKIVCGKSSSRPFWEQIVLPMLLAKNPVDIYHATWNYGLPWVYQKKCILTLHDVIPLINKKNYFTHSLRDQLNFLSYKTSLELSLRKASQVITVSKYSLRQIATCFPWAAAKTKVIYNGIDQEFQGQKIDTKKTFPIPYLMYFGGFEKRKNVEGLIRTFKKIQSQIPAYTLVVVGKKNEYYLQFLKKYDNDPKIYFTDYITNQDLYQYLANAKLMVYPSEYEGFGFPVLEAMAVGCPVITNKFSSLHEVAGEAAIYCSTSNEKELGKTIIRSINDENLLESCRLKGINRAKQFTWTQYIKDVLAIYTANNK